MNPNLKSDLDPFEEKLAALPPRRLPPEWHAEILTRAAAPRARLTRPPKWLLAGWGLAWAAVIVLQWLTPSTPPPATTPSFAAGALSPRDRAQTIYAFLNSHPDLYP